MMYNYLDVVQKTDTSDMTDEEFREHIQKEKEELEKNWTGWEELD